MNSIFSYISNLNVTTLNEHIYRGGRPKGRVEAALGFKWTANEGKDQNVGKVQKKVTVCSVDFSAQSSTCNSYNFYNSFPNQLQQVLLERKKSIFSYGSSYNGFGAAV